LLWIAGSAVRLRIRTKDLVQSQAERVLGIVFEVVKELRELVIDNIKLLENLTLLG